ncbi:Yip1 family protein [Aquimarina pacifica]|uniref:Yip1 family protein n=1 Tax=Aquimarina pacifica TaxID=1296415 RepID=UPI00046FE519|nr:Yip1 family protein [Aquimarina pacifica]
MKSILYTLFRTRKGLELLDDEFEDDLRRKSMVIFALYGMVLFLFYFDESQEANTFIINLVQLCICMFFCILLGLFYAFILFKIGQWIDGKANYIEVFSLLAYVFIPLIIGHILVAFLQHPNLSGYEFNTHNTQTAIIYLGRFVALKILIQGLMKFNQYGFKKLLINIAPLLIFLIGGIAIKVLQ